jgi:HPt (histidine-containing phosphotransfer) domain-containing protein
LKYLKPVHRQTVPEGKPLEAGKEPDRELEFQRELYLLFLKDNQKKIEEIVNALKENEIKLAHRLAHTLKSNAGQIGKPSLQQAAAEIEGMLKNGSNLVTPNQLAVLEAELNAVLSEITLQISTNPAPQLNKVTSKPDASKILEPEIALESLEKLELALRKGDPECLEFIDMLHLVPGSEELITQLIQQLVDFDFDSALITLVRLQTSIENR